ncbi:WhiB family transcriptional regulator [Amycolatopsis stemonae]
MSAYDYAAIAARLDRFTAVPGDLLAEVVARDGLCFRTFAQADLPKLVGADRPDSELAARLCRSCPVQDECLELELRTAGTETVGVWGGLAEDDRRALHSLWLRRGAR